MTAETPAVFDDQVAKNSEGFGGFKAATPAGSNPTEGPRAGGLAVEEGPIFNAPNKTKHFCKIRPCSGKEKQCI